MRKRDERRLLENEVIFKQINKDANGFVRDIGVAHQVVVPFLCECSNITCRQRIELPPTEYERIHKDPRRFIAIPGHEVPKIERVVEHHDSYIVVEKLESVPKLRQAERRLKEF